MHTPRVVIWTTSETLIDSPRVLKGVRAGLVWTETAARRHAPFPERDVLGMSPWARADDQE